MKAVISPGKKFFLKIFLIFGPSTNAPENLELFVGLQKSGKLGEKFPDKRKRCFRKTVFGSEISPA